ncbi:hypothetical protein FACS189472_16450 [Alphaproteobacteria bacterium]|nr:hypothetical protein FACS189472_16450 [Alphaproteobacteria bacterium]
MREDGDPKDAKEEKEETEPVAVAVVVVGDPIAVQDKDEPAAGEHERAEGDDERGFTL